jgi:isopentenyldiphosphate isomerase
MINKHDRRGAVVPDADKDNELIDVLDENGVKTGQVLSRDEVHARGLWHRAATLAIVDNKNRVLLQQRSNSKQKNPGKWDISASGHITYGHDGLSTAIRETSEEIAIDLGFNVEVKYFRYMTSYRDIVKVNDGFIEKQFFDFFIYRYDGDIDAEKIEFQKSEVQALKMASASEITDLAERHQLAERPGIYNILLDYLFKY